jgi:hypothetical protein
MGERKGAFRILVGRPEERRPVGWEECITFIIQKWGGELWTGLIWLRIGTGGGLL